MPCYDHPIRPRSPLTLRGLGLLTFFSGVALVAAAAVAADQPPVDPAPVGGPPIPGLLTDVAPLPSLANAPAVLILSDEARQAVNRNGYAGSHTVVPKTYQVVEDAVDAWRRDTVTLSRPDYITGVGGFPYTVPIRKLIEVDPAVGAQMDTLVHKADLRLRQLVGVYTLCLNQLYQKRIDAARAGISDDDKAFLDIFLKGWLAGDDAARDLPATTPERGFASIKLFDTYWRKYIEAQHPEFADRIAAIFSARATGPGPSSYEHNADALLTIHFGASSMYWTEICKATPDQLAAIDQLNFEYNLGRDRLLRQFQAQALPILADYRDQIIALLPRDADRTALENLALWNRQHDHRLALLDHGNIGPSSAQIAPFMNPGLDPIEREKQSRAYIAALQDEDRRLRADYLDHWPAAWLRALKVMTIESVMAPRDKVYEKPPEVVAEPLVGPPVTPPERPLLGLQLHPLIDIHETDVNRRWRDSASTNLGGELLLTPGPQRSIVAIADLVPPDEKTAAAIAVIRADTDRKVDELVTQFARQADTAASQRLTALREQLSPDDQEFFDVIVTGWQGCDEVIRQIPRTDPYTHLITMKTQVAAYWESYLKPMQATVSRRLAVVLAQGDLHPAVNELWNPGLSLGCTPLPWRQLFPTWRGRGAEDPTLTGWKIFSATIDAGRQAFTREYNALQQEERRQIAAALPAGPERDAISQMTDWYNTNETKLAGLWQGSAEAFGLDPRDPAQQGVAVSTRRSKEGQQQYEALMIGYDALWPQTLKTWYAENKEALQAKHSAATAIKPVLVRVDTGRLP